MADINITQADAINKAIENLEQAEDCNTPEFKLAHANIALSYTALIPYLPCWIPTPGHNF